MRHYYLTNEGSPGSPPPGDHYSVGTNGQGRVLAQLGEDRPSGHEQIRLILTPDQAEHMGRMLLDSAQEARKQAT